jgi:hypothetical protein
MPSERRVLAKLVARWVGSKRGIFELADGNQVELDGPVEFDSPTSPGPGDRALVVMNESGRPVRWETYVAPRAGRARDGP